MLFLDIWGKSDIKLNYCNTSLFIHDLAGNLVIISIILKSTASACRRIFVTFADMTLFLYSRHHGLIEYCVTIADISIIFFSPKFEVLHEYLLRDNRPNVGEDLIDLLKLPSVCTVQRIWYEISEDVFFPIRQRAITQLVIPSPCSEFSMGFVSLIYFLLFCVCIFIFICYG